MNNSANADQVQRRQGESVAGWEAPTQTVRTPTNFAQTVPAAAMPHPHAHYGNYVKQNPTIAAPMAHRTPYDGFPQPSKVAEDEEGLYADGESGEAGSDAPEESSAAGEDGQAAVEVASAEEEGS